MREKQSERETEKETHRGNRCVSDEESEMKADVHNLRGSTAVSNLASYF